MASLLMPLQEEQDDEAERLRLLQEEIDAVLAALSMFHSEHAPLLELKDQILAGAISAEVAESEFLAAEARMGRPWADEASEPVLELLFPKPGPFSQPDLGGASVPLPSPQRSRSVPVRLIPGVTAGDRQFGDEAPRPSVYRRDADILGKRLVQAGEALTNLSPPADWNNVANLTVRRGAGLEELVRTGALRRDQANNFERALRAGDLDRAHQYVVEVDDRVASAIAAGNEDVASGTRSARDAMIAILDVATGGGYSSIIRSPAYSPIEAHQLPDGPDFNIIPDDAHAEEERRLLEGYRARQAGNWTTIRNRYAGAAERNPLIADLIHLYAAPTEDPRGPTIELVMPETGVPKDISDLLYSTPALPIRYTIGGYTVAYGDEASRTALPFDGIVLHHTGNRDGLIDNIRNGHTPDHGDYIGYHFYIDYDGTVYQAAPMSERVNGAFGYGAFRNNSTIHIAMVGNGKDHTPEQVSSMATLAENLSTDYQVPIANVATHGAIQFDRIHEKESRALNDVLVRIGATIPILSVGDGRHGRDPDVLAYQTWNLLERWFGADPARQRPDDTVRLLQTALPLLNTSEAAMPDADGIFRADAQEAVGEFQLAHGLRQTGYVDAATARLMASIIGESNYPALMRYLSAVGIL